MRQLAKIVVVDSIESIPDAHSVEVANIKGWKAITGKGQFKVGDLGVFFEIDSMLPIQDRYKFLEGKVKIKEMNNEPGYVIKTKKMFKGTVLSQGLLMPLSAYPEFDFALDDDVTALLSIRLYEAPEETCSNLRGDARKGGWPFSVPHYDQERIQNINLEEYSDVEYEITCKCDGSNFQFNMIDGVFGVCSRNTVLKTDADCNQDNLYVSMSRKLNVEQIMKELKLDNIVMFGEIVGPKVNGNRAGFSYHSYYMFDIWDINAGKYLGHSERCAIFFAMWDKMLPEIKHLFNHVPVIDTDFRINDLTREQIIGFADGQFNNAPREGIVFKAMDGSKSFKAISNEYLLKWNL